MSLKFDQVRFIIKIPITLFICFFILLKPLCAQPPVGTDPSNPNVPTIPTALPPATLYDLLKDKNSKTGSDQNKPITNIQTDSLIGESTPQSVNPTERTYGMHLFTNGMVASVTQLSTPPLDYPIGVYDQIIVSLWGGAEATLEYTVARDGSIFPASLGKIYVQGLTFENVRSLLTQRFRTYIPPTTNLTISLGQPRTISVNVAGEVKKQGPVTVSAFTNAFNIISLAGGPTDLANLREILIKRNGRVIDAVDVYKYLTTGDFGKHIYLDNNDFVILQTVEKKVKAEGKFKRPMYYQLKKDEGIKALLKYSGGLEKNAFSSGVKVYRTELEKQTINDVNVTAIINPTGDNRLQNQDFLLNDGDIVQVIAINPGLINKIEMKGEISYPGEYEIRKGDRLFDLINRAGGITRNTYLARAYIFRGGGDSSNNKAAKVEIDLTDLTTDNTSSKYNVVLFPNDQILFFSNNQFSDKQYVEIFGEVRNPGQMNKYVGMTLQDLLYLSGGLKQSAEYGRIEIASVLNIDSAKKEQVPTHTVVRVVKISPNLDIDSVSRLIELKPYDQVYVRKNPTFELQQLVQINGLVKYEGSYPRLGKYERLSSYMQRAGGLKENADVNGATLSRRKNNYASGDSPEPVSIDLYKALRYKNSKYDVILQEGDIISIPEINPFVSVKGTVQSPLKITFDNEHTSVRYYIDRAGGYNKRPWRNRIYVTYADGKSRRTRNFFFMHFYPKVKTGSVITVPYRPEGKEVSDAIVQIVTAIIPVATATIIAKILK